MDKKTASKIWVELNSSEHPEELRHLKLDTHESVWAEMEKVRPFASRKEVNRLWNIKNNITYSNIMVKFGHE